MAVLLRDGAQRASSWFPWNGFAMGRTWTAAEDQSLRRAISEQLPQSELAAELNRTVCAVRCRCKKLGVRFRRGRIADVDVRVKVLDLIRKGLPLNKVSEQLGWRYNWVWTLAQELLAAGLVRKTGKATAARYFPTK